MKPKLRFPGFTDDWEQRKFKDVFEEYSVKGQEYLPPLTIIQGCGTVRRDESSRELHYDKSNLKNYKLVNKGDFILHLRSFEGGLELANEQGIISPAYHTFKGKEIDPRFYYPYFRSFNFINVSLKPHVYGIRDGKSIDVDGMKTIIIPYPLLKEQKNIGDFFERIDTTITLHQRKCDSLVKLKKALLQKMFPKNGESVPEIRFPGFSEPWEQRKLEESFDFLQNNTLSRAELGDSGTALNVHYGDILVKFGDCIDVSQNELPHITNQSSVEKLKNSYLKDGDVVMADTAEDETVGKCSELTDIKDKIVLSGLHTIPLRPKNKFGKGYLGYYLNSGSYHDQLKPLMQGIKVTSISKSALKNTVVSFPRDVSEQEKIGNFFIRIDNLITLHQRKVQALQKLKKALLQQMFV